jgi:hypothetical protein
VCWQLCEYACHVCVMLTVMVMMVARVGVMVHAGLSVNVHVRMMLALRVSVWGDSEGNDEVHVQVCMGGGG